jgi:hypothetical protein
VHKKRYSKGFATFKSANFKNLNDSIEEQYIENDIANNNQEFYNYEPDSLYPNYSEGLTETNIDETIVEYNLDSNQDKTFYSVENTLIDEHQKDLNYNASETKEKYKTLLKKIRLNFVFGFLITAILYIPSIMAIYNFFGSSGLAFVDFLGLLLLLSLLALGICLIIKSIILDKHLRSYQLEHNESLLSEKDYLIFKKLLDQNILSKRRILFALASSILLVPIFFINAQIVIILSFTLSIIASLVILVNSIRNLKQRNKLKKLTEYGHRPLSFMSYLTFIIGLFLIFFFIVLFVFAIGGWL